MKRFQNGEFDNIKFSKCVRKQSEISFIRVDEDFQAGTRSGIQNGAKGDYLFLVNGEFKVVSAADFNVNYDVVNDVKEEKAPKAKTASVKKVAKTKKAAPVKKRK